MKLEAGGREQFMLTTSVALDEDPLFFMKNWAGTLVYSSAAANSGDGYYYEYATMPSSVGMYTWHWLYAINANTFAEEGRVEIVQTLAVETAGLYCNANDVINLYERMGEMKITNAEIDEFIRDIMNEIDGRLGNQYSVPFQTAVNSFPQLIGTITKNLTLVSIMERKGGEVPGWITTRSDRFRGMLDALSAGSMWLVLSGGDLLQPSFAATVGQVDHSMEDYVPTFNMLGVEDQRIDPDRTEDEEDAL